MENVAIKLKELTPEFHYFEDNQVLTAGQLNQVIDYFDRQTRLSRTKLTGTGIICGLEIDTNLESQVTISKGSGITSDGDLLHLMQDTVFNQFVAFDDAKAAYPSFWQGDPQVQIPLIRLYPDGFADPRVDNLQPLENISAQFNLSNMVVVLYLNSYLEPPEECTEIGCENRGPRQRQELVVLLVNRSDLDAIPRKAPNPFFNLEDIDVKRVPLTHSPNNPNNAGAPIDSQNDLFGRFKSAIDDTKEGLLKNLLAICGNEATNDWLFQLTSASYNGSSPILNWQQNLEQVFNDNNLRAGVQYVHEYMKDLALAYSEFRECIFELYTECCPNPELHPKHLMVRELSSNSDGFLPHTYRHYFCESPAFNRKDVQFDKAIFLHRRIHLMINSFEIPTTSNNVASIEITPTRRHNLPLGERPIPIYYPLQFAELVNNWNFKRSRRGQSNDITSYHNRTNQNASPSAKTPFNFCKNDQDFFRIEGHLGLELEAVKKQIQTLRDRYNISFRIEEVLIEKQRGRVILPGRFKFPSVRVLLDNYREDLFDKIVSVKDYSSSIKNLAVDTKVFEKDQELRTNVEDAQSKTEELNSQLETVKAQISGNLSQFETSFDTFDNNYRSAIKLSHEIKDKVYNAAQTKHSNPLQNFVFENKALKFKRLLDFKKRKEDAAKDQFIFDNFLERNNGLEHKAGVPEGGTLVLIYTMRGEEKRVVADFCLPYCCQFEEDPEVDYELPKNGASLPPIKIVSPGIQPFPWVGKLDLFPIPKLRTELLTVNTFAADFEKQTQTFYKDVVTTVVSRPNTSNGGGDFSFGDLEATLDAMLVPKFDENNALFDEKFLGMEAELANVQNDAIKRISAVDAKAENNRTTTDTQINQLKNELTTSNESLNSRLNTQQSKVAANEKLLGTHSSKISNYDSKIKVYDTKIGEFDTKFNKVDDRFKDLNLGNVRPDGNIGTVNTGGTIGGNLNPGGGIIIGGLSGRSIAGLRSTSDPFMGAITSNLENSATAIRTLDKKADRTEKENEQLKKLTSSFKDAASTLLENLENLEHDIEKGDENDQIIESIKKAQTNFSSEVNLRSFQTKVNKLIKKHKGKTLLVERLKGL